MPKPTIRAIETEYKGYRMRSRLEARWATFFDSLGIPWEYEPEGYESDDVRYLPDFWLPGLGYWIEVKPKYPSQEERDKAEMLVNGSGLPLFFLIGTPTPYEVVWGVPDQLGYRDIERFVGAHAYEFPDDRDGNIAWGQCMRCLRFDLSHYGECPPEWDYHGGTRRSCMCPRLDPKSAPLIRAYREARSARFEQYPPNMRKRLEDAGYIGGHL